MDRSEALLASIGWEGAAMVEYRHDPATARSVLMEINGRFWGSIPLAHHCGAQFGWETYRRQVLGETTDETPALKPGRARYMVPDAKHLVAVLRNSTVSAGTKGSWPQASSAGCSIPAPATTSGRLAIPGRCSRTSRRWRRRPCGRIALHQPPDRAIDPREA